jgi:hypothetical protein
MPKQNAPNFALHTPNSKQLDTQHALAALAQTYATGLADICPAGPALDQAFTALRESVMWGNQSIVEMGMSQGAAR